MLLLLQWSNLSCSIVNFITIITSFLRRELHIYIQVMKIPHSRLRFHIFFSSKHKAYRIFNFNRLPLQRGPFYHDIAHIIAGTGAQYQSAAEPIPWRANYQVPFI